jgi:hypothetical protein
MEKEVSKWGTESEMRGTEHEISGTKFVII